MFHEKKLSFPEDGVSEEEKFGEELKKRLSILQSQEDFALDNKPTEENNEKIPAHTETTKPKNVSIFRPLQKFIPSNLDLNDNKDIDSSHKPNYLFISLVVSILAGLLVGTLMKLRKNSYTKREVFYIQLPGSLFERSIEIVLIPYITSSIISSVGKLPSIIFLKITSKIIIYSILTSMSAAFLGIIVSFAIPNFPTKIKHEPQPTFNIAFGVVEVFLDICLNILPKNIVYACISTEHIRITENNNISGVIQGSYEIQISEKTNYIGLVTFCVFVGMALHQIGNPAEWFFCLTDVVTNLMALITSWLLWVSPLGLFFNIIGEIVNQEWSNVSSKVGIFSGLFILGLTIQCLLLLPLVFYVITFSNPFRYISNTLFGLLTGFATCSGYAATPFLLEGLQRNKVNSLLANAAMPLLATINKNGNAVLCSLLASYLIRQTNLGMSLVKILQIL
uniref:Amino acid transporter n=1 Tax=Strigamia maritima TaxID=126957 RepID=T1JEB1_STRMM